MFPEPKNWMSCNKAYKKELLKLGVLPWILLYVQQPLDPLISENKETQMENEKKKRDYKTLPCPPAHGGIWKALQVVTAQVAAAAALGSLIQG